MKSYSLEGLSSYDHARVALSNLLPQQVEPWLLIDEAGDAVAFLTLASDDNGAVSIQADLSGRHYEEVENVIVLFHHLQSALGDRVTDDDDNVL